MSNNVSTIGLIDEDTPVLIEVPQVQPVEPSTKNSDIAGLIPAVTFASTSRTTPETTVPVYSLPSKKKQTPITSFVPKIITGSDKNKIDLAILILFVWDFQPFSMVEDRGFRNLMGICSPSYQIPNRKYFANTMMPALFEETCCNLKSTIEKETSSVCLTTDIWTSLE